MRVWGKLGLGGFGYGAYYFSVFRRYVKCYERVHQSMMGIVFVTVRMKPDMHDGTRMLEWCY